MWDDLPDLSPPKRNQSWTKTSVLLTDLCGLSKFWFSTGLPGLTNLQKHECKEKSVFSEHQQIDQQTAIHQGQDQHVCLHHRMSRSDQVDFLRYFNTPNTHKLVPQNLSPWTAATFCQMAFLHHVSVRGFTIKNAFTPFVIFSWKVSLHAASVNKSLFRMLVFICLQLHVKQNIKIANIDLLCSWHLCPQFSTWGRWLQLDQR